MIGKISVLKTQKLKLSVFIYNSSKCEKHNNKYRLVDLTKICMYGKINVDINERYFVVFFCQSVLFCCLFS